MLSDPPCRRGYAGLKTRAIAIEIPFALPVLGLEPLVDRLFLDA